jgi:hypothetical protein
MAWLPENAQHDLLAAVPAAQWNDWADGAPIGIDPHRQPPSVWGCRINANYMGTDGVQYKKGMQGQLLEWNNKGFAKIFIRGVTEGNGFTNRWILQKFVDKGKPWHEDIADWQLNVHLPTYTFDTQAWTTTSLPDTSVLGKTVTRLVTTFRQSPARFAPAKLTNFIDNANITVLSRTIIQGIKDAGLYDVLSQPAPFSAKDLMTAARYKIRDSSSSDKAGVYARFHESNDKVKYWKAKSSYCYVGKTNNLGERHGQHLYTKTSYGDLTRNSSNLVMIALYILDADSEHEAMFFLVEQIYVCLLDTYRESLLKSGIADTDMLKFCQAAKYFTDISKEVFCLEDYIRMLSGRVRSDNAIVSDMNQSKYKLDHVDGTFGVFPSGMKGERPLCDTCLLIGECLLRVRCLTRLVYNTRTPECVPIVERSVDLAVRGPRTSKVRESILYVPQTRLATPIQYRLLWSLCQWRTFQRVFNHTNRLCKSSEALSRWRTMAAIARTKTSSKVVLMTFDSLTVMREEI